jgi:hypothetical protein
METAYSIDTDHLVVVGVHEIMENYLRIVNAFKV